MKKPTFSKAIHWIEFLFENLFHIAYSFFVPIEIELEKSIFKKRAFSAMQNRTFVLLFLFFSFLFNGVQAQVGTKFSARLTDAAGNKYLKVQGDIKVIGNTILTPKGKPLPFNDSGNNNELDAVYLDIDGNTDRSTFSSSSSDLKINNGCKKIVFAGLYWSAMYPNESSTDENCFNCGTAPQDDWNQVKFKVPGATTYTTLTASKTNPREVIFKGDNSNNFNNGVYVCFKDVTSLLTPLTEADGTYVVANVRATTGKRRGGSAGGWSLVVIYESPTVSSKYISVFDGAQMTNVDSGPDKLLQVDIPISGFQTLPSPFPVKAKIGVAALDGDYSKNGDGLLFVNGLKPSTTPNSSFTPITNTLNLTTLTPEQDSNFFNASITVDNAQVTTRNPTSTNNLGFDIDYLEIPNPSNTVIPNGATDGTYRMFTNTTGGDGYAAFLTTFAVDIIEPKILLTKEVYDNSSPPKNMGNKNVTLGQQLNYVIGFQNQGNDNATSFTITDKLPINTIFSYPSGIDTASLPPGVTHSYDNATKTITFKIPNNLVEINDPRYEIRLKVNVVNSCNELSDVCSNIVQNTALSDYTGTYNLGKFGDKSLSSYTACNVGVPQSTNFLVGVDACKYTKSEVLCTSSVVLTASSGYDKYEWSTKPYVNGVTSGTILGNTKSITVNNPGTYYVYNTAKAPCLSITEEVTVTQFGGVIANPVIPYASKVVVCPNDGKNLPLIFLCGANSSKLINTNISDGSTIVWEKLDEASCSAVANANCANENTACTWTSAGPNGPTFTANTSGQFRLTLNYPGGCFQRFYFNVYQNLLSPTETHRDIICTTTGNITVGGVPAGYEYSIDGTNYQPSNSFTINTEGLYTVYIRQVGVTTNPCVFTIPNIPIRKRNFTVDTTVTHPLCFGDKGSIKVAANDVRGQYYYELFKGGTSVKKVGPVAEGDYTFDKLSSGDYSFTVKTDDGCSYTNWYVNIKEAAGEIIATPAIKRPLTDCTTGIIKVTTSQDKNYSNSFYYFVNGSSTFQSSNEIEVTTPGLYTIKVVGTNNCEKTITIDVPKTSKPTYTVSNTNSNCYDDSASITINLTSPTTGYTMAYSINGGASYQTGTVFSNLQPGTYNVVVKSSVTYPIANWPYTETKDCIDPAQTVVISGPSSAINASAGVAKLAGCGTPIAGQPTGLIRFTNVEGGTPSYLFSFDGGGSWQNSPEKEVVASTVSYDLRVKDSKGCIFKIPYNVIMDPKPADPQIDDNINPIYNCDGTATATVVVNTPVSSGATYTYEYYLKTGSNPPVPNVPLSNNVFKNVPSGNHTVIVKYNIQTVSTYSNLLSEDFGRGADTSSPGINSAYCFERQDAIVDCNRIPADWHPWLMNDGDYVVTKALLPDHANDFQWMLPKDHSSVLNNTPGITDGRFLAVNIGKAIPIGAVLYSKPINDVIPNQDINVELYMLNLLKSTNNLPPPQLTIQLVKGTQVVASQIMQSIPRDEQWHSSTALNGSVFKLNPGSNTSLDFQIISNSQVVDGNDLAVDDIHVYQVPLACGNEKQVPIVINTDNAFNAPIPGTQDAKCSGQANGTITITASNFDTTNGFYYSIDNGVTWKNPKTSPATENVGAGKYNVIVKNDVAGTCSYSFKSEVKEPQAILIVKVDKTQPTCTTDGTITVTTVSGGTGVYEYQLSNASGIVQAFQKNKTFTGVKQGSYTIQVKDANGCFSPASAAIAISDPTPPTAALDVTTDYCYTTADPAKLVVKVTGGTGPFAYSLDGQASQSTNTFTNVTPGTHEIIVTDSNNCTAKISNIVIASQLTFNVSLLQDLTCLVNASIGNPVITAGNGAPYTYTVAINGGGATAVTSFPYTATVSGTYVFTVTDGKSCPATSNTITVTAKTTPTLTFAKTDSTCNNANNGTITITPANGFTSVYTYEYKLSAASSYASTPNPITGLSAGTYNIRVIDSKGCVSAVSNVTIANPALVSGTISATDIQCSATGTVPAVVTVVGSGGIAPYQYSFNGTSSFSTTNTFPTSIAATVTAYVKDANNCQIGPLSITIAAPEQFTAINVTDSGWDCSTTPAGGHVNIAGTGVSSPKRYSIISGPTGFDATENSDGEFKGLAPGAYVFQVRDTKTNCTLTKSYTVSGVPDIVAGGSVLTPIKCFGDKGTIQFTVNGVKDKYDYVIKNAANAIILSANNESNTVTTINVAAAQPAGVYTITVTDKKTSCKAVYSITLSQPTAALAITSATSTKINCNKSKSDITVTAANGTPNYTYAALPGGSTATPTYASSNIINVDTNNGTILSWDIYVKDANDCSTKTTVAIGKENIPIINTPAAQCYTGTPIAVTITGTATGIVTYSKDGTNFQASPTFNLSPGSYTLAIKDGFGCPATTPYVVASQLTLLATPAVDTSCTPNTTINLTANGGTGAYAYAVSVNGSGTYTPASNPYVTATAGTYKFRVTDSASPTACQAFTADVLVNTKTTVLTLSTTKVDLKCKGDGTGSITVTATSGKAPFTYSIDGGTNFGNSNAFTNLSAGTYKIMIKDALGCTSASTDVIIAEPAVVLTATAGAPATTTCSTSTTVTVTGHDGTAPYTYSFKGGAFTTTNTFVVNDNGTSDQTIAYQVKDANGCITVSKDITVKKLNPPTGINFSTPATITCLATTTSITLTPVAGVGPFSYKIIAPASATGNITGATNGTFSGLLPGNYTFEVKDFNGCTKQASTTIDPAATIAVSGVKTDVKCFGTNDGTATFTVTGASSLGNFTYALSPNVGTITQTGDEVKVTGLAANTYTLTVTDKTTGCTSNIASVTINPATAIIITGVTASNVSCSQSISNIVVSATGGAPTYKYAYVIAGAGQPLPAAFSTANTTINTGATQSNISWDVYVMDQNDCIAGPFNKGIKNDDSPSVKSPAPSTFCFKAGTPMPIDVSTFFNFGTGAHTYTVNGTAIVGTNYNITGSGTYTIVAKDANSCTATATYVVQPELTILATRVKDLDCISNGQITFVASNGTSPYTKYEVQVDGVGAWSTVTSPYSASVAGNYQFRVTDTAGCQGLSNSIEITPKTTPTYSHNETQISCIGGTNGVINITNPTGIAPFTYLISKVGVTVSTSSTATGLSAGTYDIVVTDGKGCPSAPFSITLANPIALSATVSSTALKCGVNNATVGATITVTSPAGGSGGYEYSFNGGAFSSTPTYTTTLSGLVTVVMRDSNHCPQPLTSQTFVALNPPTLKPITGTTLLCTPAASTTSTVTVAANAGTGVGTPSYMLVSGPMPSNNTGDVNGIYTGLIAGTYVFKVTDANGCTASDSYTVKPLASITASLFSQVNVKCNGGSTGSATINVSGFAAGDSYKAALTAGTGTVAPVGSTTSGTVNVTGLVQGVYTLRVTDDVTGCFKDINFTITEPLPLTLAPASNINANCNQPLSKVTVTAGGGKAPYSFAFINSPSPAKPAAGDYTASVGSSFSADLDPATPTWYAWVKDANGCETPLTVNIVKDAAPSITLPAQQCFTGTPFSITLSGTGTGTLTYSVNGSTISGNTYTITAPGTYKLGVTDANNCTDIKNYIIEKQLLATAIRDKHITCSAPTAASITVNITNGTAPFSYQIYDGAVTVGTPVTGIMASSFTESSFSSPGNYSFEVKDSKGCIVKTNIVDIVPKVDPVMNPVTLLKPILCKGESTAEITVTYDNTKGTAPFVINVKQYSDLAHTAFVKDFGTQTSGLPAGYYVVTVTDAKGCSAKEDFTISEPNAIDVDYKNNPITCVTGSGISKGSIVVNSVTGGSGNYTYQVFNNNGYVSPAVTSDGTAPVTFDLIDFGNYQLTVIDTNGCSWVKQDIPIASPPASLTLDVVPSTPVCGALGSAVVKVGTPEPGSVGFYFAIYKPGITYSVGDPAWIPEDGPNSLKTTIPNLIPGVTYTFIVFDDTTKCYYFKTFTSTVPSGSTLTATATPVPITCKGAADGAVNLNISSSYGSAINVKYEIFDSATLLTTGISDTGSVSAGSPLVNPNFGGKPIYAGLPVGTYYVLVTEMSGANVGCTKTTAPFSITESTFDLEIDASKTKNDNCKSNAGIITAIGKKGTGPYNYAIVPDGALRPTTFASANTFAVESGDWDVYVKDAYGCIQKADVNVPLDPAPAITAVTPSSNCYTGTAITVTISTNGTILGPVTYSVDKGAIIGSYGSSASFALSSGTYTLNVKDGNGCTASAPYIIKDQLTLAPTLTKELDCLTASPNATVTVEADGGNTVSPAAYAYTITAGPTMNATGATTGIFTDLAAGNYTFEVNDGTCTATTTMSINALIPIAPTKAVGIPLCVGGNASVEIKATGGTGSYEYKKGALGVYSTTNIFSQSAAEGTVTYYVKDSKGCEQTIDAVVTDPTPITISNINVNQMTCGGGNLPNDATIKVTASGGTGVLQYSFDNGANYTTNNIYTTTIAGNYQVIVKDANECATAMQLAPVDALDPPLFDPITPFTTTQMTCPALVSDVTIHHTNGIAPLAFKIVSGPTVNTTGDISGTYSGLAAGDYMFRITDKNGCITEKLFTVPTVPTLDLVPQVVDNVNCNGGTTGSATFTASGLFATGAFTVTSVVTTPIGLPFAPPSVSGDVVTLTGLVKGQYDVTITDNTTLCSITKSVTITEPALALGISAVASNVNCNDGVSQLTMTPTGGTPNYTYSIVQNGAAIGAYSNGTSIDTTTLTNGVVVGLGMTWLVDVHIKDANNCTAMTTITITKDDTPTVTTTALATNQCTATGNYTFTATGTGVAPLSFSIDGTNYFTSAGTTYTFTVPAPTGASQAYTVTVKDKNGCIATSLISPTVYKPLTLNVVQDKDITCVAMPTTTAAQFTLTAGDGNPAVYIYAVSINGAAPITITSPYTSSTVGTYVFQVTDANICTVLSDVFNVTATVDPVIVSTPIIEPILCVGGSAKMQVNVNPLTGLEPYTYTVTQKLPAVGTPIVQLSNNIFTGLLAGTYDITVTDAKGCISAIATQVISDPAVLSATASHPVNATCSVATVITVVGAGGTPTGTGTGYYYSFNGLPYDTSNTFTVNDNGAIQTITYTVKDANGCITAPKTISVNPLKKPTDLDFTVMKAPTCPDPTSDVTLTATNGVAPLVFKIISGPTASTTGDTSGAYTGLAAGDYTFQVTDANGCSYQELYTVKAVVPIAIVGAVANNISCNVLNGINTNGSATFTVTGVAATSTYMYDINGGTPITGQTASTIDLTSLIAGTYKVTVTDETTLCSNFASVTLAEPVAITFNATASNVFCSQDVSQITVSGVAGGTGVYQYAVVQSLAAAPASGNYSDNNVVTIDTKTLTNGGIVAGNMTWAVDVYVKDANGCFAKQTITVTQDAAPTIKVPAPLCFTGSDLTVDLSLLTTTYNGNKSYTVNGFAIATSTATFKGPGTYKLGIKDDHGCEDFVDYTIEKQLLIETTLTKDLYCSGTLLDATVKVVITNGVGTLSTQLYSGVSPTGIPVGSAQTGSNVSFNLSTAGDYYVVTTDSNSSTCPVTSEKVTASTPTPPTFTENHINVSCNGGNDGSITITPADGLAPYTFALTGPVVNHTGDATGIYTGLKEGSYTVVVTDAKGCPSAAALPIVITEPGVLTASAPVTPFGCDPSNAPQDAIVTINAAGGTAPYSYSFDNGANWQTLSSHTFNSAQTINYIVHDANGCSFSDSAVVPVYAPPIDMDLSASPIYCSTVPAVASVTVNGVTGGVAPYTYDIISPMIANNNNNNVFAGLAPNTYIIKVTDANGCSTTKAIVVKEADKISVTSHIVNDVYCNGGATAAVNFTVANYITAGNFTPLLNPNLGTMTINGDVISYVNLPKGNYTFSIKDDVSQCVASANITINEPAIALSSTSVATHINCTEKSATITVTAKDGTAPYKYAVAKAGDPVPTNFVTSDQLVVDTNNGADINWVVYVKDANGCDTNNAQVISLDTNPTIANAVATQCPSSAGTYDITVTASGFSSALQYSVDGISFQDSNVITVSAPGNYNVTVRDTNGCFSATRAVNIFDPLIFTPTAGTLPSCANNNGVINVSTTGGSGNYEYKIDSGIYTMTTPFTGLAAGLHKVYVHDTTTNCEVITDITLEAATLVTNFAATSTPVSCNGGNDGTITAAMDTPAPGVNDNPVYKYTLTGTTFGGTNVNVGPQDSSLFTGLRGGNYTINVVSGRGCPGTFDVTVAEPAPITVNKVTISQFGCTTGNASNFASITVNPADVTGGSGVYKVYEFIKGTTQVQIGTANTYTEYDLAGGTYTVNVYDSNGCMGTYGTPIPIAQYIALDKINVVKTAITCKNPEDITVTAVDVAGNNVITNIEYTLTDVSGAVTYPVNTNGTFPGLPVGQYIITAKNTVTGCSIQKVHYINEPNTFNLNVVKTSDVVCYGSNDGAVSITLVDNMGTPGKAGAFDYTVTGPMPTITGSLATAGPLNLTGLKAGQYTVSATLKNTPFCTVTTVFTISQPDAPLSISKTSTAITCIAGNNDGTISVSAVGGWSGGYEYQLENSTGIVRPWSAVFDFTGLTAENYTVRVRDSKGCIASVTVPLVIPTPIAVTASANIGIVACNGDTSATITATAVTGGQGSNYSYTLNKIMPSEVISSGPQNSPIFTGLGAGTYSISVTDGWTCSATSGTVTITEPTKVEASLTALPVTTCNNNTTLTLTATGGTGPYKYNATQDLASAIPMTGSGNTATIAVNVGTYHYYVWDAKGCISFISNDIKIDALVPLTVNLVKDADIKCRTDVTGAITATAVGGLGNYVYTLQDATGKSIASAVQASPGVFTQLPAGSYKVHVDSGDCSKDSAVVTIVEPTTSLVATAVATPVTCNGIGNGKIEITATGGTGIIKYAISPNLNQFFEKGIFIDLKPGVYDIITQDQNGCYVLDRKTITEPTAISANVVAGSIQQEYCAGDKTGAFKIAITGGVAPYSTVLDDPKGVYVQDQVQFKGLSGGDHTVYIKDANSCTYEMIVKLNPAVLLDPIATVSYDCVNDLPANKVTVAIDASNNPADVKFSLDSTGIEQGSNVFTNLAPGDHFIMAHHKNGCVDATPAFTIDQIDPLNMTLDLGGLNEIVATVTGGSGVYQFSVNGESIGSNNKYIYFHSGNYTVTVTDSNGCSLTVIKYFEFIDIIIPPIFTPNGDGDNDSWKPTNTENYPDIKFVVYDRYGREVGVFGAGQSWDGRYNGTELPMGDYWYVLKLKHNQDDREFIGHFTLYR